MNITLRKIKHNKQLSHETHCYSADLYVDGKFAGIVGNPGHGGPDEQHFNLGFDINLINAELAKATQEGEEIKDDLEVICCNLVNQFLTMREVKKCFGKRIVAVKVDGQLHYFSVNQGKTKVEVEHIEMVKAKHPEYVGHVLNEMTDEQLATVLVGVKF